MVLCIFPCRRLRNKRTAAAGLFLVPHTKATSRAPSQFVDMQLDVSASGIELAVREGFKSVEHVKRYTAMGFGTDQGKLGNINGMAILANALGQSIDRQAPPFFAHPIARPPLALLPGVMWLNCLTLNATPQCIAGTRNRGQSLRMWASGSDPGISLSRRVHAGCG